MSRKRQRVPYAPPQPRYTLLSICAGWGVTWQAERVGGEWQFRPVLPEMDEENAVALREWMEAKRVGLGRELREWAKNGQCALI